MESAISLASTLSRAPKVVDERSQRSRCVAPLGIVQVVTREGLAEFLEHSDQLTTVHRLADVSLEGQREAKPCYSETPVEC